MWRATLWAAIVMSAVAPFPSVAPGTAHAQPYPGYTVSRTHGGFRLTLHFSSGAFPANALVKVTVTLRNLSRRNITVDPSFPGPGRCGDPTIQIFSVNNQGQSVEPVPSIPLMPCHGPGPVKLTSFLIGRTVVTHELFVLRSTWLRVQIGLAGFTGPCYCGFNLRAPALYTSSILPPAITVRDYNLDLNREAIISPQPPGAGPLYYQDWAYCYIGDGMQFAATGWHRARSQTIHGGCLHPDRWHIDAAWVNTPVATLNLNPPHHAAR